MIALKLVNAIGYSTGNFRVTPANVFPCRLHGDPAKFKCDRDCTFAFTAFDGHVLAGILPDGSLEVVRAVCAVDFTAVAAFQCSRAATCVPHVRQRRRWIHYDSRSHRHVDIDGHTTITEPHPGSLQTS